MTLFLIIQFKYGNDDDNGRDASLLMLLPRAQFAANLTFVVQWHDIVTQSSKQWNLKCARCAV